MTAPAARFDGSTHSRTRASPAARAASSVVRLIHVPMPQYLADGSVLAGYLFESGDEPPAFPVLQFSREGTVLDTLFVLPSPRIRIRGASVSLPFPRVPRFRIAPGGQELVRVGESTPVAGRAAPVHRRVDADRRRRDGNARDHLSADDCSSRGDAVREAELPDCGGTSGNRSRRRAGPALGQVPATGVGHHRRPRWRSLAGPGTERSLSPVVQGRTQQSGWHRMRGPPFVE